MTAAPTLTVVGAINLDLTARVHRAPERGETVADGILTRTPGGKGANQAIAAARLGARVRMVGAVGDDATGTQLAENLDAAGVDVRGVQRAGEATGTALIVVDAVGENSIVVCPGANLGIALDALDVDPHAAVLAQLEVPVAAVEAVADATDGFFALNVSPAGVLTPRLLARADLLIVNEAEFEAHPDVAGAPLTAVTLGARGAYLLRGGVEIARATVTASEVVNTVGAGDAFAAALTVGLIRGDTPSAALHRACAVGAAAVADAASQPALAALDAYPGG